MIVALWSREKLAADSGIEHDPGGWGGVTLAHNVGSPAGGRRGDRAGGGGRRADPAPRRGDLLGRLLGRLRRPRRPSVGGRPQPPLDDPPGRQRHASRADGQPPRRHLELSPRRAPARAGPRCARRSSAASRRRSSRTRRSARCGRGTASASSRTARAWCSTPPSGAVISARTASTSNGGSAFTSGSGSGSAASRSASSCTTSSPSRQQHRPDGRALDHERRQLGALVEQQRRLQRARGVHERAQRDGDLRDPLARLLGRRLTRSERREVAVERRRARRARVAERLARRRSAAARARGRPSARPTARPRRGRRRGTRR